MEKKFIKRIESTFFVDKPVLIHWYCTTASTWLIFRVRLGKNTDDSKEVWPKKSQSSPVHPITWIIIDDLRVMESKSCFWGLDPPPTI